MASYPNDYLYSDEHEWIKVDGDVATLGITHFAQDELGEVVFVELPEVGTSFDAEDEIGTIESVKAVAELYTPVSGEVVEVHGAVADSPELVNQDPHGEGWLVKIKVGDQGELSGLMSREAYESFLADEEG